MLTLERRQGLALHVSVCVLTSENPLARRVQEGRGPLGPQGVPLRSLREYTILSSEAGGKGLPSHSSLPSFREQQAPASLLPPVCPPWPGREPVPPAGLTLSCPASRFRLCPCPTRVLSHPHPSVSGPRPALATSSPLLPVPACTLSAQTPPSHLPTSPRCMTCASAWAAGSDGQTREP